MNAVRDPAKFMVWMKNTLIGQTNSCTTNSGKHSATVFDCIT